MERFIRDYYGMFGKFKIDEDSDESYATASSPDGDSTSMVGLEISTNADSDFESKCDFIKTKQKRLGPMGNAESFIYPSGFDEHYGVILNYDIHGKKGGFFYYTGRKGCLTVSIQAYHTQAMEAIPESERNALIDAVFSAIKR